MPDTLIAAYAGLVGFVAAGIVSSFYQLVTATPAGFRVSHASVPASVLTFLTCVFAGPFLVVRNAMRLRRRDNLHAGWLLGALGVSAGWSLCSGVLVLQLALSLRHSLA